MKPPIYKFDQELSKVHTGAFAYGTQSCNRHPQQSSYAPYFQHSHINYRMSNVRAGIGRGQMMVLNDRISQRREILIIIIKSYQLWLVFHL